MTQGTETVARYFTSMMEHDWPALRSCLADDFSRVGPYAEHVWNDPEEYVAFVSGLLPGLRKHGVEVTRVSGDGAVVHAEATETVELDGRQSTVRIAAVFDLDDGGRIRHVEVFVRRPATAT